LFVVRCLKRKRRKVFIYLFFPVGGQRKERGKGKRTLSLGSNAEKKRKQGNDLSGNETRQEPSFRKEKGEKNEGV